MGAEGSGRRWTRLTGWRAAGSSSGTAARVKAASTWVRRPDSARISTKSAPSASSARPSASGGGGIVLARAVAADLTSGVAAARLFSLFMTLSSVAPILAPVLGGVLLATTGSWRPTFWVLAVVSLVLAVATAVVIPETLPAHARHRGGRCAGHPAAGGGGEGTALPMAAVVAGGAVAALLATVLLARPAAKA